MLSIEVHGTKEIAQILLEIEPKHARNLLRATVGGVSGEVRDLARAAAPKDRGILRRAIKVKRERIRDGILRANVEIERKKGALDAFYWRFVEYGTRAHPARPFLLPALRSIEARLPEILREQFVKKLEAALVRERKKRGIVK